MEKNLQFLVLCCFVCFFALPAHAQQEKLVGNWQLVKVREEAVNTPILFCLSADGSYKLRKPTEEGNEAVSEGKWNLIGNRLICQNQFDKIETFFIKTVTAEAFAFGDSEGEYIDFFEFKRLSDEEYKAYLREVGKE